MGICDCFNSKQFKILVFAALLGFSACKKTESENTLPSLTPVTSVPPSSTGSARPFIPPDTIVTPPIPAEVPAGLLDLRCFFIGPDYKITATWGIPVGAAQNVVRRRLTGNSWDMSQYLSLSMTQNSLTEVVVPGRSYDYQIKFSTTDVTPVKTLLVKASNCVDMTPPLPPYVPIPDPTLAQVNVTVRTGSTVVASAFPTSNYRGMGGAYDKINKKFLMVYGNNPIGGLFLDDDGNQEGAGFQIASTSSWTQLPRVACATNEDICLVTYHKTVSSTTCSVYGKLLRYTAGGVPAFSSDEFPIGGIGQSWQEGAPALAYSPDHREFLVTWTVANKGAYARRVKTSGQMPDPEFALTQTNVWVEQTSVAYNAVEQSFIVVAMQSTGSTTAAIISRKVKGGLNLVAASATLDTNLANAKITDVEYDDYNRRIIAFWYAGTGGFKAAYLSPNGLLTAEGRRVFSPFSSYDGFDVAYSPASKTFFGAFHGSSAEDFGAELDSFFAEGPSYQVTYGGAVNGTYHPRVVAHPDKPFWIVMASRDYGSIVLQKITRP